MTLRPPRPPLALDFDGSSYVNLPDNLIDGFEQSETLEAWFQTHQRGCHPWLSDGEPRGISEQRIVIPAVLCRHRRQALRRVV